MLSTYTCQSEANFSGLVFLKEKNKNLRIKKNRKALIKCKYLEFSFEDMFL